MYFFQGFAILQINFRGSTGMGGDNIEYLSGRIGEIDVLDCVTAINLALNKYAHVDPKRVCLYGICHGGFLCAHLSGQHAVRKLFFIVFMKLKLSYILNLNICSNYLEQ